VKKKRRKPTRKNSSQRNNQSRDARSGQLRKNRNKHHIIFPESLCDKTEEWRELRTKFIIDIDQDLHVQLHRYLDQCIGTSYKVFLNKRTANYLLREYYNREKAIGRMKPIAKITWLRKKLNQCNGNDSKWLLKMLSAQIVFLKEHKEEI